MKIASQSDIDTLLYIKMCANKYSKVTNLAIITCILIRKLMISIVQFGRYFTQILCAKAIKFGILQQHCTFLGSEKKKGKDLVS